jgi:uncharacterized protein (TIGR03086 family)
MTDDAVTDDAVTDDALSGNALYERAAAGFDHLVHRISGGCWDAATPCQGWTVRDLVNHLAAENCWVEALLGGESIEDVGDRLAGDLLGADPVAGWDTAYSAGLHAARAEGVGGRRVVLGSGPATGDEYLREVGADHLVHMWDLAVALGADDSLDSDLVREVGGWFLARESAYRAAGAIGPRPPVEHDDDPQTRLLAMFGRARPESPSAVVERFAAAFNAQDVDGVMKLMSTDCVFESTDPPDGVRYEGQSAVRAAWERLFASSPGARFTSECAFSLGDRVVAQWRYDWAGDRPSHVRGVDIFRLADGLITEKASYVKG